LKTFEALLGLNTFSVGHIIYAESSNTKLIKSWLIWFSYRLTRLCTIIIVFEDTYESNKIPFVSYASNIFLGYFASIDTLPTDLQVSEALTGYRSTSPPHVYYLDIFRP